MNILGNYAFLLSTLPDCTGFMLTKETLSYYLVSYKGLPKEKKKYKSDDQMEF